MKTELSSPDESPSKLELPTLSQADKDIEKAEINEPSTVESTLPPIGLKGPPDPPKSPILPTKKPRASLKAPPGIPVINWRSKWLKLKRKR